MKKLLAIVSLVLSTTSFASANQCLNQATAQLTANINQEATHIVRLEGTATLAPQEESMMFEGDIWNSSNSPVEIYIFRLNTRGITHRVQIKMSLPQCKLLGIYDHGLPL